MLNMSAFLLGVLFLLQRAKKKENARSNDTSEKCGWVRSVHWRQPAETTRVLLVKYNSVQRPCYECYVWGAVYVRVESEKYCNIETAVRHQTKKKKSAIQIKLDMEAKFRTGTSNDLGESRGGSVGRRRGFDSVKEWGVANEWAQSAPLPPPFLSFSSILFLPPRLECHMGHQGENEKHEPGTHFERMA